MTRREKIERWEEEIVRLDTAQKEMVKKTQEKMNKSNENRNNDEGEV